MSEIYLLNVCKMDWEKNLFDFYVEPVVFRIKILINITLFYNQWQPSAKLNIAIIVNVAIFLGTSFFIKHFWWLLLNPNLILAIQILTKTTSTATVDPRHLKVEVAD